MSAVYQHPDGFALSFEYGALVATDNDGGRVRLPIGRDGLAELAAAVAELASPKGFVRHAGAELGFSCVATMAQQEHASDRIDTLAECLAELSCDTVAIAAFATVLETYMDWSA